MKAKICLFFLGSLVILWLACAAKSRCQESKDKIFSKKCQESTEQVMVSYWTSQVRSLVLKKKSNFNTKSANSLRKRYVA